MGALLPTKQEASGSARPLYWFYDWADFFDGQDRIITNEIFYTIFQDEPPVFDAKGLRLRTNKFANFREYCNIFYPLLMHELWANVFKDYMQTKDNR